MPRARRPTPLTSAAKLDLPCVRGRGDAGELGGRVGLAWPGRPRPTSRSATSPPEVLSRRCRGRSPAAPAGCARRRRAVGEFLWAWADDDDGALAARGLADAKLDHRVLVGDVAADDCHEVGAVNVTELGAGQPPQTPRGRHPGCRADQPDPPGIAAASACDRNASSMVAAPPMRKPGAAARPSTFAAASTASSIDTSRATPAVAHDGFEDAVVRPGSGVAPPALVAQPALLDGHVGLAHGR